MSIHDRPNPDEILEAIKLEEAQLSKGRLKIFLGMAPGVGKTYSMLEEAQVLRKEGIDVVVGNIEAHGRKETELLLENLPQIPKKTILYKSKYLKELDVDAIIQLNPSIVLIDELAHSNVPGSKHEKRWQDILEILEHGIDVHTTLNVQHIESLNDVVLSITEMIVKETIPDIIIETAHSIQLIDLTPDELLQRLKEGKVYLEGQSKLATLHFFQKNKLTALREVVLRYVADKIDIDLRRMVPKQEGRVEWKTREKFLVAINHSSQSPKLIRTTLRLATQANSPWVAVYVNTGKILSKKDDEQLTKNFNLTRDLGAEIVTINDPDVAEGIKKVAYQRGITQIILGRTPKNTILSLFQGPTLLDKLAAECKDIDLHVIRQEKYPARSRGFDYPKQSKFSDYVSVAFLVGLLASFSWAALHLLGYRIVEFLFFFGICTLSFFFNQGPVIFAAILFGIIWGVFFIPPPVESSFSMLDDNVLLILYVLTSILIGIFINKVWKQKELLTKAEKEASQFAEIFQELHSNLPLDDILIALEGHLPKVVEGTYKLMIKNNQGILNIESASTLLEDKEVITALWAFENAQEAGWSTETLPFSENLYIPLKGHHEMIGLLVYRSLDKRMLTVEERKLIKTFCQQLSTHLEKST